jgi:signal transduction histidine kinase
MTTDDVEQDRVDGPATTRRVTELLASRARLTAASDDLRRRLHRDLHEGPQQRVAHAVIALKILRDSSGLSPADASLVAEALGQAQQASIDLREIVRRTLPGTLLHGGLRVALDSLAADMAVPVEVRVVVRRLPADVEMTAYLVVVEALTNAVQQGEARRVQLDVRLEGRILVIEVSDDGVGGADDAYPGWTALFDRVDVAEGSLTVASLPGRGTTVWVRLPVGSSASS